MTFRSTCVEIKIYGAFVLNQRVVLHAIDATPARWRGDAGSSPLDRARTAASSPGNDLVKNCAPDALVDFHTGRPRGAEGHAAGHRAEDGPLGPRRIARGASLGPLQQRRRPPTSWRGRRRRSLECSSGPGRRPPWRDGTEGHQPRADRCGQEQGRRGAGSTARGKGPGDLGTQGRGRSRSGSVFPDSIRSPERNRR